MAEGTSAGSKPQQLLSVYAGASFIIGIVIGIGIFRTPSLVASGVGSETLFIAAWVLGGVVMLVGALCYAELGSAHPDAGGEYHYLTRAFGRPIGVLFGWARGTVIQTGAIAAVAFVYADYASNIIPLGAYSSAIHAVIGVVAITALNLIGTPQARGRRSSSPGSRFWRSSLSSSAAFRLPARRILRSKPDRSGEPSASRWSSCCSLTAAGMKLHTCRVS
jgi:hypothetical protein